ncbi:hypothetical protein ACCW71_05925, partial [Pantoea sp. C2G6]
PAAFIFFYIKIIMKKSYHFENTYKKWTISALTLIIMGAWLWYISWASSISNNTILKKIGA